MTVENGLLSGPQINGMPVRTSGDTSPIRGGSLAAQFEIRDVLAPEAQQNLDALSVDLIARFADPAVDPTLNPGDPGLFTDGGAGFVPGNEVGLSNRLELNALVDPQQGGQSWRLRDGLNATAAGPEGNASQLNALQAALNEPQPQTNPNLSTGALTASGVAEAFLSTTLASAASAEQQATYSAASFSEAERIEAELGVDTDEELQSLTKIETAYAANARMLEVLDELMETLLRI